MRIIIYPETRRSTIGRFDEVNVQTCALIIGHKADLDLIPQALDICTQLLNPLGYMKNLCGQLEVAEISEKLRNKLGGIEIVIRISKQDLLALVPAKEENPERLLFFDIHQMAQTANDLIEVAPEVATSDEVFREDTLSVLTSLTAALELIMTNGIPLRDRFDIFESEGRNEFRELNKVIKFMKSPKEQNEPESKVE